MTLTGDLISNQLPSFTNFAPLPFGTHLTVQGQPYEVLATEEFGAAGWPVRLRRRTSAGQPRAALEQLHLTVHHRDSGAPSWNLYDQQSNDLGHDGVGLVRPDIAAATIELLTAEIARLGRRGHDVRETQWSTWDHRMIASTRVAGEIGLELRCVTCQESAAFAVSDERIEPKLRKRRGRLLSRGRCRGRVESSAELTLRLAAEAVLVVRRKEAAAVRAVVNRRKRQAAAAQRRQDRETLALLKLEARRNPLTHPQFAAGVRVISDEHGLGVVLNRHGIKAEVDFGSGPVWVLARDLEPSIVFGPLQEVDS